MFDGVTADGRPPGVTGNRRFARQEIEMETKRIASLALGFFALFSPLLVFAQPTGQPWDGPGPWHMWSSGFWWIFPLLMLFMMVVCVAIFFLFLGHRSGGGHRHWGPWQGAGDPNYSALQILNERFAKGEIQKQEYEEKKVAILSTGRH
jgi:putative membrane protein